MTSRKQSEENLGGRIEAVAVTARTLALLIAVAFWALATPSFCCAQVQLPAVNLGDTNFEDGFGGPGWLFQEWVDGYVGGELKDSHGNTIPGRNRTVTYSATTHVVFVSKKRVFGGWLSAEALQPLVDLDVQLANSISSRVRGFADLTLGIGLQWKPKKNWERRVCSTLRFRRYRTDRYLQQ